MSTQILFVLVLTFLINLIATLSYSVRMVGIRTGRIAISFALFNILVLVSRTANGFQAPLLAKTVENNIHHGIFNDTTPFRFIILSCTLATMIGAFLVPTFQRVLSRAVLNFSTHKSVPRLLYHAFSKSGILYFRDNLTLPSKANITRISADRAFPWRLFIIATFAIALLTIGVLSTLYAGYLNPTYRTTAGSLTATVNGLATILLFVFVDPHLSAMTDDVMLGKCPEATFRKHIVYMTGARFLGTIVAQLLFLPGAYFVALIASRI